MDQLVLSEFLVNIISRLVLLKSDVLTHASFQAVPSHSTAVMSVCLCQVLWSGG